MGGAQRAKLSPLAVAAQAKRLVKAGLIPREPIWYQPVLDTPPMTDLSRRPAQTHQGRVGNKPTDIREIQSINRGYAVYFRKQFYKEHPWELARPKVIVEEDGADYVRQDWSRMEQFAKPLDGESVVQRALYLMKEQLSPIDRWQKVRGFDPTLARGRPLPSLPLPELPLAINIPEPIKDKTIQNHREQDLYHQYYSTQIDALNLEIADLERTRDYLIENSQKTQGVIPQALREALDKAAKETAETIETGMERCAEAWKRGRIVHLSQRGNPTAINAQEEITPEELHRRNTETLKRWRRGLRADLLCTRKDLIRKFWTNHYSQAISFRKAKIPQLIKHCQVIRRRQHSGYRISPQEAYLQACSEFYCLRQQEEMDVRMAIIQARQFGRRLGQSVNEKEVWREGRVLAQWEREANRLKRLTLDPKMRKRSGESGEPGGGGGGSSGEGRSGTSGGAGKKMVY